MKIIYFLMCMMVGVGFQNCSGMKSAQIAKENALVPPTSGSDSTSLSSTSTLPANYSLIGPITNYTSLQINDVGLQIDLDLQSALATGSRSFGNTGQAKSCTLQNVRDQIQSLIGGKNICVLHRPAPQAGYACAEVANLGFLTLIRENEVVDAQLPQRLALGGDAGDTNGECHSEYVLCDPQAQTDLQALLQFFAQNSVYGACDPI